MQRAHSQRRLESPAPGSVRGASPGQVRRNLHALGGALNRRRRLRLSVRAIWLGLLVIVGGLAVRLAGYMLPWPFFVFPGAFVTAVAVIYAWSSRPALAELVRGYDRHFGLHELLATGLEVSRQIEQNQQPPSEVTQGLIEQTVQATGALRRRVAARSVVPWSDLQMVLALAMIALGLLIPGLWSGLPDVEPVALRTVPTPAAVDSPPAPQPTEVPVEATEPPASSEEMSPEDAAAAEAIADALRDGGATRSAADALDRGDPAGAASDLRELADQVEQLSPEARRELAEELSDAADDLRPSQPEQADRLERQADQLEDDPADAAEGLEDLADMIEELGTPGTDAAEGEGAPGETEGDGAPGEGVGNAGRESPDGGSEGEAGQAGGGAGQGLGGERRGGATDPPLPGGDAAPLPPADTAGGQTAPATGPRGPSLELGAGGEGTASGGGAGGSGADTPLESEPDPLSIPPEYRDVVENYFSPPQ